MTTVFENIPRTSRGHFLLHFYAAVFRTVDHLRRLHLAAGKSLQATFDRYPFLAKYYRELRPYLPDGADWDDALAWWEQEIAAWEQGIEDHLPFRSLAEQTGLPFASRMALAFVGLVEEDSRFGTLFAELQEPLASRRPSLELVGQVVKNNGPTETDDWSIIRPLIEAGLIEAENRAAPRAEWVLSVPAVLWDAVKGQVAEQPATWCRRVPLKDLPKLDEIIASKDFLAQLQQVPAVVTRGDARVLVLRGTPGSDRFRVMAAVARAMGRSMVSVEGSIVTGNTSLSLLGPLCTMTHSLPVITFDLGPGEVVELPRLAGYAGPLGILLGMDGGVRGEEVRRSVTLSLTMPGAAERRELWEQALGDHPAENLTEIGKRFRLPGCYIRQAAASAIAQAGLEQRNHVTTDDVRRASRSLNHQILDSLTARLEAGASWDDLVVSGVTWTKLRELELRCSHREDLLEHLGSGFGSGATCGVRALFTGVSGTGKTLAARILAGVLGMDVYRVDLAAIMNKYVGETEKNLNRVLSRAEELDVILLIDEGDSLLGKRTDVRSANDRYANLETNFLLQRLENYSGIAVVTTNAGEHIDTAFQRRMDVVVNFYLPQAWERLQIWRLHLPAGHAVESEDLEEVSSRCALSGGQIRNAALHATLLAVDDSRSTVDRWHLEEAIRSEYRKAGAICPLGEHTGLHEEQPGIQTFLDALSR